MAFVFPPVIEVGLCSLVLTAAVYDLRSRRIPTGLAAAGFLFGVGLNTFLYGDGGLRLALLGALLALAVYVPIYALHGIGGGDVKLMAAIGCIVGPSYWLRLFIFTAGTGLIAALCLIVLRGRLRRTLLNLGALLAALARFRLPHQQRKDLDVSDPRALTMPHAVTIAVGSIVFLVVATVAATPR